MPEFPDEEACARHLVSIRWPEGFKCSACGLLGEPWWILTRPIYSNVVTAAT
ncbi:MAG: transposase [Methylococcaceae bacterium]